MEYECGGVGTVECGGVGTVECGGGWMESVGEEYIGEPRSIKSG